MSKFDENEVICEVCHKPYRPDEMKRIKEEYEEEIYRPNEDVSDLANLSEAEKSDRRRQIEEIFKNPDAYREAEGFTDENEEPE